MYLRAAIIVTVILIFGNVVSAQCGSPSTGNCCEVTVNVPACQNAECCNLVCAELPWCCSEDWNVPCVNRAAVLCHPLCGSCGFTSQGDCCAANGTPGCKTATCCESVCAVKPSCCEDEWDESCADLAWVHCPELPGCEPPPPITCGSSGTGSCCDANGSPFCTSPDCCINICAEDPYCCEVEWDECCAKLAAETCMHPVWPDSNLCDDPPVPDACSPGAGDCCSSNGTPGCDDEKCCHSVCIDDPFCCDTTWDSVCAAAWNCDCDCGVFCDPICVFTDPQGNCFETGGTGCFDFDCCESVCACDPFCCTVEWDEFCVGPNPDAPGCSAINLCCHLIQCNPADLTLDNVVDVHDVLELLSAWGPCPGFGEHCPDPDDCPADFDGNGIVNVFDLLYLLANWG